jgi:hypothetical protein
MRYRYSDSWVTKDPNVLALESDIFSFVMRVSCNARHNDKYSNNIESYLDEIKFYFTVFSERDFRIILNACLSEYSNNISFSTPPNMAKYIHKKVFESHSDRKSLKNQCVGSLKKYVTKKHLIH